MDSAVSTILITIAILAVVFLILREVNCWYWKINERISLQREQNSILEKILLELKNEPKSKHKSTSPKKRHDISVEENPDSYEKEDNSKDEEMVYEFELTSDEQKEVDAFVKFGIMPGQLLVMNKNNRKIEKFDYKDWDEMNQSEWIILIEN